ncbi:carbohydrate porin [Entomobacter blattae]|uniref:carbohydrate porin n=1 Tax=Entomobacter blattae TaxID=2762277 RepID=UPI00193B7B6E|nr:carbohydrate porin [Entomobacter blattae]
MVICLASFPSLTHAKETKEQNFSVSQKLSAIHTQPSDSTDIPEYKFLSQINNLISPYGLTFGVIGFGGVVSNVAGGLEPRNSANANALFFNVNANLEKMIGWQGGQIHFQWGQYIFRNNVLGWDSQIGDMTLSYQHPHLIRSYALQMLTYEQTLIKDTLTVEAGRTNLIRYFTPDICTSILTCFSNIWIYNINIAPITTSHWAGVITYNIDKDWTLRMGASEINPSEGLTHGTQFSTKNAIGATGITQLAYSDKSSEYNNYYGLMAYYNGSTAPDPFYNGGLNVYGKPKPLITHSRGTGVLAGFSQEIWKEREKNGRALSVYGTLGSGFESYDLIAQDAIAGFTLNSLVPGIPDDKIGLQLHWSRAGKQQYRAFREYGVDIKRSSYILTLLTQFQVVPGVLFQPSVQYAFNPNNFTNLQSNRKPKNAVVIGMMMLIDFNKIF